MAETHSRAGKRVERVEVTDDPHERYQKFHPFNGNELEGGIPILTSKDRGNVLEKDVSYRVVTCPECDIPARYTSDSEPVCPECGIICSGTGVESRERFVVDAKAAGRVSGEGEKAT